MKSKFRIIGLISLFISILYSCATTRSAKVETWDNETLLYRIKGNGIKTSYILGIISVLKLEDFNPKFSEETAFNKCEQLILETDLASPDFEMEMMQNIKMRGGKTLKDYLSEEEYELLNKKIKSNQGYGLYSFEDWLPQAHWQLMIPDIIGKDAIDCAGAYKVIAEESDYEILGLESIGQKLSYIHEIPYKKQAEALLEYVYESDKVKARMDTLLQLYLSHDVPGFYNYTMKESKASASSMHIREKRFKKWISKIGTLSKEKSSFIVVDVKHLGGPKGVLSMLKAAGYKLKPIRK